MTSHIFPHGVRVLPTARSPELDARLPGCVHQILQDHGLIPDPLVGIQEEKLRWISEQDWEFEMEFRVPASAGPMAELECPCIDTIAELFWNGVPLGRADNMFRTWRWQVQIAPSLPTQKLRVRFPSLDEDLRKARERWGHIESNDAEGGSAAIRKMQCNFGWDWGPRFVTCGFGAPPRLNFCAGVRPPHLCIEQIHNKAEVELQLHPEGELGCSEDELVWSLALNGSEVARGTGLKIRVPDAQLWQPNGLGPQPLYQLSVRCRKQEAPLFSGRIGLRTIELVQREDAWGRSFEFHVNGQPVFAKGANWIPAHVFPHRLTRGDYEPLLRAAAQAGMNMIRVWAGGIYEKEEFYDLCDELGLLVWQDFMVASIVPAEEAFIQNLCEEAREQVRRLQHRACLALWCGNNEIEQKVELLNERAERAATHDRVFYDLLPGIVRQHAPQTAYWPGSPHNPEGWRQGFNNPRAGDAHYWQVWFARDPIRNYEKHPFRFVSEYGMQSFPSRECAALFDPPRMPNVFTAGGEAHQKNGDGNVLILHYMGKSYPFPKAGYDNLAYVSQLMQARCIRTAVEYHRRIRPRCMGTMFWQLNDCWPATSWSAIEFGGRPKALMYQAREFFANVTICPEILGEESVHRSTNTFHSSVHGVAWHGVNDTRAPWVGELRWRLLALPGECLEEGRVDVRLEPGCATQVDHRDLGKIIAQVGRERLVVAASLVGPEGVVARRAAFLTEPRFLRLGREKIHCTARAVPEEGCWEVLVSSPHFHHGVELLADGSPRGFSENYFDLLPHEERVIRWSAEAASQTVPNFSVRSLVDAYEE